MRCQPATPDVSAPGNANEPRRAHPKRLTRVTRAAALRAGLAILVSGLVSGGCSIDQGQSTDATAALDALLSADAALHPWDGSATRDAGSSDITPVFVTIAGHIEDNPAYAACDRYPAYRQSLIEFAEAISIYTPVFNLQTDYEFLTGVQRCETPAMQAATDGKNVLDFLVDRYGFEIDPHQEGGWERDSRDNYADVRFLGGQVTGSITETVGGFVWQDPEQILQLASGEPGRIHPEFTWRPDILTLAVGTLHHQGNFDDDDLTSGIWRPAGGGTNFYTDDASGTLIYVGPGLQHSNWSGSSDCTFDSVVDYVSVLVRSLHEGTLPAGKIYTATLAVPQGVLLDPADRPRLLDLLARLQPLVASGEVVLATYRQVVDVWLDSYAAEPNQVPFDAIDPADYTCPQQDQT